MFLSMSIEYARHHTKGIFSLLTGAFFERQARPYLPLRFFVSVAGTYSPPKSGLLLGVASLVRGRHVLFLSCVVVVVVCSLVRPFPAHVSAILLVPVWVSDVFPVFFIV